MALVLAELLLGALCQQPAVGRTRQTQPTGASRHAQDRRELEAREFRPPSPGPRLKRQLERIRSLVRPDFYSTQPQGRKVRGLGGLPEMKGPVLIVGNHQLYGFLDQPLLVEHVWQETGVLLRSLSHRESFREPASHTQEEDVDDRNGSDEGEESSGGWLLSVDVERFGAVRVSARALYTLLSSGQPTLLYPGGMREAFKSTKQDEGYRLVGWPNPGQSADFARLAARFDATILTVACVGAEDGFSMLLDAEEVRRFTLFGWRLVDGNAAADEAVPISIPLPPQRYYYLFGKPRSAAGVDPKDKRACRALLEDCRTELEANIALLLERREEDPCRHLLPRLFAEKFLGWVELPTLELN